MADNTQDRLLDNTEAAALLSISPRTLVAMRDRGELPFVNLLDNSKGYRYSAKALTKFIADRQQRNPTASNGNHVA